MSDFQFRTRGQQSPQEKQRVYFTCHPDDFEKYFEDIQKEILDRQDCAVFFLEPSTEPESVEDYELRLREMQLFVVPVTTKLLTEANRAMNVEVPFAFKNHIPVLPLMQESGLDDVFNAKFGDLQYLNKYDYDPTAIPYDEKLTKYLDSVIVGDKLAKKVRAAFDAYIFLSYRKKDRKYAQELMKLIHSNPLCRDIAIWYDEFLTPGENFNDAIREALEKSDLFALTITPNLVNEINYILTTEYPMAKDMGKKILPAEMEQTDRNKLREMYADIPELIANGDTTALADKLTNLFESLAIRENDTDPQHNFFIGLAYLGGLDVEVNHERAIELITGSAKTGYIPAIQKLVSMYNNGEGLKRDYYMAVEWLKRLLKLYENLYQQNPNEFTAGDLIDVILQIGDNYRDLWQIEKAILYYEKGFNSSKQFSELFGDYWFVHAQSGFCDRIATIYRQFVGDLKKAEEWQRVGIKISEELVSLTQTQGDRRDLSIHYANMGSIVENQEKLNEAEEFYYKSLGVLKELVDESRELRFRFDLANCYRQLGRISEAQCLFIRAKKWFYKSLDICESLVEQTGLIKAQRDLSICYEKLGEVNQKQGKIDMAIEWYNKSLPIVRELVDTTGTIDSLRDLSVTYNRLGNLYREQGLLDASWDWHHKALAIAKTIVSKANTKLSLRDLSVSYHKIGLIAELQKDYNEAEKYYFKAFEISEVLAKENDSIESIIDLIASYHNIGRIAEEKGDLCKAEHWYRTSVDIAESFYMEAKSYKCCRCLYISYISLGEIMQSLEQYNESEKWYCKCLAVLLEFEKDAVVCYKNDISHQQSKYDGKENIELLREILICYERIGDNYKKTGNLTSSRVYYENALQAIKKIVVVTQNIEDRRELAVILNILGDIADSEGELSVSKLYYEQALDIVKVIAEETNSTDSYDDLAFSYYKLGTIGFFVDKNMLEKAFEIWQRLLQQYPDNSYYQKRVDTVKMYLSFLPE